MAKKMAARTRDRATGFGRRLAATGVALGAAAGVSLGPGVPDAAALNINQQVYTAGPLLSLLPLLGVDTVVVPLGDLPLVGESTLTLNFVPNSPSSLDLYNTVNALGFQKRQFTQTIWNRVVAETGPNAGNFPMVIGSGFAAPNLVESYRAQISSVNGTTPPGYTPFQPGPVVNPQGQNLNTTNEVLVFLNNSLRPNGGLQTRFAPILNIFGVDTTVPGAGYTQSTGIELNAATLDVTWAYDPISDFPVTLNPFSILNSLAETLPINLIGGIDIQGLDTTAAGTNVAGVLGIINNFSGGFYGIPEGEGFYGTLVPKDLPILEPLRLPARLLSAITGVDFATPFADALQPAFKILVNIGYSDVVTPTDIANDPGTYGGYQPYDRTYLTSGVQEPFLSVAPLTPAEWLKVPGDVVRALFAGFNSAFPHPTLSGRYPSVPVTVTPPALVAAEVAAASVAPPTGTPDTVQPVQARASLAAPRGDRRSAGQAPRAAMTRQKAAPAASSSAATASREATPKRASARSASGA